MTQRQEEFKVAGEDVIRVVKQLIAEGNVRRISIKNEAGVTLFELPLTIGVIGAIIAPALAAVGAIAALVTKCTIVVERKIEDEPTPPSDAAAATPADVTPAP